MFKLSICLFVLAASSASGASVSGLTGAAAKSALETTTEKREVVPLLSFMTDKSPDGSFKFAYEGGDQSARSEQGVVMNAGTDDEALEVSGSYRYIDADGQLVEVTYTAGRNGFVPIGTHILPEISALAKAAADLPNYTEEEEREQRLTQRRARSQTEEKQVEAEKVEKVEKVAVKAAAPAEAAEPAVAASEVVPVQVLPVEAKAVPEKSEKTEKVETKTA